MADLSQHTIDPKHGRPFRELGVKSGDWVRLVADCSMHGTEIQVPPRNKMYMKSDCFGNHVGISDFQGELRTHLYVGLFSAELDLWIRVYRGGKFHV